MRGRLKKAARHPGFARCALAFDEARPRVAVYTGQGASHSWIWFCDLLEHLGVYDVGFVDEGDVLAGSLGGFDMLLVGGGDTYAMAESLGRTGARGIEEFVRRGGLYHGSCAGAYLVLSRVDLEPFTPFDLIDGDMLNVMREPPRPLCLEHKYLAPYGPDWVFHPVYGEVELEEGPAALGLESFQGGGRLSAPLFGGPVLDIDDSSCILADYAGVTGRAAFLWPRADAERLIAGRQAAAVRDLGEGTVSASGPHLEHPLFADSNVLLAQVMARHWCRTPRRATGPRPGEVVFRQSGAAPSSSLLEIKREVSNARIIGFGLEKTPVTWKIGVKVWEPEKIRMFLDVAWERLPYLESRLAGGGLPAGDMEELAKGYAGVTALAKNLRIEVESGRDSQAEALSLLTRLKELTASFLALYFAMREQDAGAARPSRGDGAGCRAG